MRTLLLDWGLYRENKLINSRYSAPVSETLNWCIKAEKIQITFNGCKYLGMVINGKDVRWNGHIYWVFYICYI